MNIRTIRINSDHPDHEQGFYIINESDFDEKIHKRWAKDADAEAIRSAEAKRAEVIEAKRAEAQKESDARKAAFAAQQSAAFNKRDR